MSNSSFLKEVARDMYSRFQNDMTNVVMVFPNKRASLFLNRELAGISDKPVWAPQYQTISELFLSLSPYTQIDPITCVCKLYDCYCKALNSNETIDDFYGWGEVIMNDLDDIDNQMVDVKQLFKYMEDWNQLSATSDFLSEDQITALKTYFRNFSIDEKEKAKERFIKLWRAMPEIYSSLKETLKKDSLMYKGALYRDVVENHLDRLNVDKTYIFVGFNVLTKVEHKLIDEVNSRASALFYWDYDDRLTADSEGLAHLIYDSGKFIREYLKTMPNSYKPSIDNVQYNVDIQYIKTDSVNAQSRYVPQWITQHEDKSDLTKTAVILADESMLPQVLEVLTDDKINITMGYKLSDTPVLSYIIALSDLQLKGVRPSKDTQYAAAQQPLSDDEPVNRFFYYSFYNKTRNHPFTVKDDTLWNKVVAGDDGKSMLDYLDQNVLASFENFNGYSDEYEAKADADSSIDPDADSAAGSDDNNENETNPYFALYAEALYRTHLAIEKLRSMNFDFGRKLTCRLLEQVLRSQSVPFHGEPLEGLQVMGVLETRSLDFDNILLLSANDGILPKRAQSNSLVPYCLRQPFGLTTEQEQVNIYAYIFFRLLQRAKHITLMFPISSSDMGQCEMSRFMRQLLAETDFDIKTSHLDFSTENSFAESQIQKIGKTNEILKDILYSANGKVYEKQSSDVETDTKQKAIRLLSLSSINNYLNCPLQFYFRNVAKMRVKDEISSTIQPNQFGTVFHSAAQYFYTKITDGSPDCRITEELLEQQVKQGLVDLSVDEAFRKEIFDCEGSEVNDYVGELVIARKVIVEYLQRLVEIDKKLSPFRILQMEKFHYSIMKVNLQGEEHDLFIGGIIDRLDYIENYKGTGPAIRIVDYKTGGKQSDDAKIASIDDLYDVEKNKMPKYVLQTFLYSQAIKEEMEGKTVQYPEIRWADDAHIMPSIIFIKQCNDAENYDARIIFGQDMLTDFRDCADEFKKKLSNFLNEELFNPEKPFEATSNDKHCKYCDYRLLCGKKD